MDVEHHLPLDQQVHLEGQRVGGDVDGALDGVLDRHEATVHLASFGGSQHLGHARIGDQLSGGQVGLRQQRLFGEGAGRAQEADAQRCGRVGLDVGGHFSVHDRSG